MERVYGTGFFDFLRSEFAAINMTNRKDALRLPFDFWGGYVGYLGYELKVECGAESMHASKHPDAAMFFADRCIVVDHSEKDVYLLALSTDDERGISAGRQWIGEMAEAIQNVRSNQESESQRNFSGDGWASFTARQGPDQYKKEVYNALDKIAKGETYEVCLTTMMENRDHVPDPSAFYRELRRRNPAPFAAFLNFSGGPTVCSSSPERFLKLDRHGDIEAKPIKGTRPRKEPK